MKILRFLPIYILLFLILALVGQHIRHNSRDCYFDNGNVTIELMVGDVLRVFGFKNTFGKP